MKFFWTDLEIPCCSHLFVFISKSKLLFCFWFENNWNFFIVQCFSILATFPCQNSSSLKLLKKLTFLDYANKIFRGNGTFYDETRNIFPKPNILKSCIQFNNQKRGRAKALLRIYLATDIQIFALLFINKHYLATTDFDVISSFNFVTVSIFSCCNHSRWFARQREQHLDHFRL